MGGGGGGGGGGGWWALGHVVVGIIKRLWVNPRGVFCHGANSSSHWELPAHRFPSLHQNVRPNDLIEGGDYPQETQSAKKKYKGDRKHQ